MKKIINKLSKLNLSAPIGIFDSGVGGLSIAKSIQQNLPNEQLIYIADSFYAPYGDKNQQIIISRVQAIVDYLVKLQVKAIVIACNTATAYAIDELRKKISVPIIGVEPAIKPAAIHSQNHGKTKKIAILTTKATAENVRFLSLINTHSQNIETIIQPCPGLVELIELNQQNSAECLQLLQKYLAPLNEANVDALVLGCTHYPFLIPQLKKLINRNIQIIETSQAVSDELTRQLTLNALVANKTQQGSIQFYSSDTSTKTTTIMAKLWQQHIEVKAL